MRTTMTIALALSLGLGAWGCAPKAEVLPQAMPTPLPASKTQADEPVPAPRLKHVTVRRGDSLWAIATREDVLGDPFRWPLLFRRNRDQIQDPDLIEPGQDLGYDGRVAAQDALEAVQMARQTPPYAPHSSPRAELPLKY